jgi:NACHT domain
MPGRRPRAGGAARRPDRLSWLPTLSFSVLAALAALIAGVLQGQIAPLPIVIAGLLMLVVISITQSVIEQRRRKSGDPQPGLSAEALATRSRSAREYLIDRMREWMAKELSSPGRITDVRPRFRLVPDRVDPRPPPLGPDGADAPLPGGTSARDLYDRAGSQLLILGEPGAGKTALLAELARSLLDDATRSSDAVPVVFQLQSWAVDRQALEEWLVAGLSRDYGVNRQLGGRFVEEDRVIPLLDGLDEVAEQHRTACVEAINDFHQEHGQLPLVVCSRVQEYEEAQALLHLRGAVEIEPLAWEDVLDHIGRSRSPGLSAALQHDPDLCQLLTTPLLLHLASIAYQDRSPSPAGPGGRPPSGPGPGAEPEELHRRRARVLTDYVNRVLRARGEDVDSRYGTAVTLATLGWLASAMQAHRQPVFYLDRVQPDWLRTPEQRRAAPAIATAAVVLLHVLLATLAIGLVSAITVVMGGRPELPPVSPGQLVPRLAPLAPLLLAGSVALALVVHDRTIEPVHWSHETFRRNLPALAPGGGAAGALLGSLAALVDLRPVAPSLELLSLVAVGTLVGLLAGLGLAAATGYELAPDSAPAEPSADIRTLRRTALTGALAGPLVLCPLVAAICAAALQHTAQQAPPQAIGLIALFVTVPLSLFSAVRLGGGAYLRHRAVLRLLARDGLATRDMIGFLAHAARLNLVRRQGGGYEFVHPLMRQWFAELQPGRRG